MLSWLGAGGKPKEEVVHPRMLCILHVSHAGSGLISIVLEVQKQVVTALGHLSKMAALLPGTLPRQLWRVGDCHQPGTLPQRLDWCLLGVLCSFYWLWPLQEDGVPQKA